MGPEDLRGQPDARQAPATIGRASWRERLAGFGRNRNGSVAVEFALLAVPFLGLIFAIFQTSMVHITGQVLQTAISDASRLIMTGQAQAQSFDQAKFKAEVCKRVTAMFNCNSLLQVDVKVYNSFSAASVTTPPVTSGNLDTSSFGFSAGTANQIVVVRGVIAYPIIIPMVGKSMVNLNGNKLLIMATAAFQNEPF